MTAKKVSIIAILVLAAIALFWIGNQNRQPAATEGEHGEVTEKKEKGPHGGRLLRDNGLQIEVTIYEPGTPPIFRVYAYEEDGTPIDPAKVDLRIEVHRIGNRIEPFSFHKEQDYLTDDQVVYEPHSFEVKVFAAVGERKFQGEYSQYEGRTKISPEALKSSGIEIATAGPARIRATLDVPGEVLLNQDRVAHIAARLPGSVSGVQKTLGDSVKEGETLVILESRELAQAKQEYIESVHRLELAKSSHQREEGLWKKGISPEEDYLQKKHAFEEAKISKGAAYQKLVALGMSQSQIQSVLRNPDRNLTRLEVKAPFRGTVIEKKISLGEMAAEDQELFVIADLSSVWVDVNISAQDIAAVRVGQSVLVESKQLGKTAEGKIKFVGPIAGGESRSAKARILLSNKDGAWRPGLFVNVKIVTEETSVPVAIKASGLQTFRDWDVVFVQYGEFFEIHPLELGRRDANWIEVVSGLAPGAKYAAENSFTIKADIGKSGASHDH